MNGEIKGDILKKLVINQLLQSFQRSLVWRKFLVATSFAWFTGLLSLTGLFQRETTKWNPALQAQVGLDFNQRERSGSINLAMFYRLYHNAGNIIPREQSSLHLTLNGFFWLGPKLSTRFSLGLGIPLMGPQNYSANGRPLSFTVRPLFFYEGEFALRFTLLKANYIAMSLGMLIDTSEAHSGHLILANNNAISAYLQTGLGVEFEMAFALSLEYLLYFRLKVPLSTYNAVSGEYPKWGFYPRQGSLELAFLFHKGPSFGLSKAARTIYFGPFYRFEARVLDTLPSSNFILSHTIGLTYYIKPPF